MTTRRAFLSIVAAAIASPVLATLAKADPWHRDEESESYDMTIKVYRSGDEVWFISRTMTFKGGRCVSVGEARHSRCTGRPEPIE